MGQVTNIDNMVIKTKQENGDIASLTWALRKGYPRVTVYLKESVNSFDDMMIVGMTYPGILTYLNLLKKEDLPEGGEIFKSINAEWVDGERTGSKIVSGEFKIYDNEDGERCVDIKDVRGKKATFILTLDEEWFKIPSMTKAEISKRFVDVYVTTMQTMFTVHLANNIKEKKGE